jgi:hypothetical protein
MKRGISHYGRCLDYDNEVKAMTFNEIFEVVSRLGFDTDLEEYRENFIDAMNRGFRTVTRVRPRMESVPYIIEGHDHDLLTVDVKTLVNGDEGGAYGSLPMNPVRTKDGQLYRTDRYRMLNRDTILFLREAEEGEYIIDYVKAAQKFNLNDFESEADIDLDEDLCDALALYVSYYLLLEENEELSAQYFMRYQETMAEIRRTQPSHTPNGYQITKRW